FDLGFKGFDAGLFGDGVKGLAAGVCVGGTGAAQWKVEGGELGVFGFEFFLLLFGVGDFSAQGFKHGVFVAEFDAAFGFFFAGGIEAFAEVLVVIDFFGGGTELGGGAGAGGLEFFEFFGSSLALGQLGFGA